MATMAAPIVRAPRGTALRCKGWQQEAALRCLMNNLDPENAERPADLVVYGGIGKAARNWECFHAIVRELERLGNEETLLVQSGKPVAVFPTHEMAPRVLIANSNLVGKWATWEHFNELDRKGLMMYGQMTAGSWIYIGTQGILQGTFQTFAALAERHFAGTSGSGSLKGKLVVTGGMGGMGGAQPLVGHAERRRSAGGRSRPQPHRAPRGDALLRLHRGRPGRGAALVRRGSARGPSAFRRPGRQLRRRAAGDCAPRRGGGRGDRPDQRARSAEWLRSAGAYAGPGCRAAPARPERVRAPRRRPPWWFTWTRCWLCNAPARLRSTTATIFAASPSTPDARTRF